MQWKIRPWRLLIFSLFFAIVVLYLSTRTLNGLSSEKRRFSFSAWLQGEVLGVSYEDRYCKDLNNDKNSKYPPVNEVAKQLNIKDGETVFLNGIHCGEWLVALKQTFPNIKLFGVDQDREAVEYVSKLVKGNFSTAIPYELQNLKFDNVKFDHAIIDGVLSVYSPEYQCKTIRQMIPMLKAGGSLYIGKNIESCDGNTDIERDLERYLHVQLLSKCYWTKQCLKGRNDIVEILYSQEKHMFPELHEQIKSKQSKMKEKLLYDFSTCATSVFIYRHIVLLEPNKDLKQDKLLPESKHESGKHAHKCTKSQSVNSTQNKLFDKEGIKNAIKDIKLRGLDPV